MYKNIFYDKKTNLIYLWDDEVGLIKNIYKPYAYKKSTNGAYTSIYGDKLMKVNDFDPHDSSLFEADVSATTRTLIDLYGDIDDVSKGHVVFNYDIEVSTENGLPNVLQADNEINSIAWHESKNDQFKVLLLDKTQRMANQKVGNADMVRFDTERELLLSFLREYEAIRPTIITGWNCEGFDNPYIYHRIQKVLGESFAAKLSPVGIVYYSKYKRRVVIAGVSSLDALLLYKNFTYTDLPSYSLDFVAKHEIKRGKFKYEGSLDNFFKTDVEGFIKYNLTDVELVKGILDKMQLIEIARQVCHSGCVPYEDIFYSSRYLEGAVLNYLRKKGLVAPSKPEHGQEEMKEMEENDEEGFSGAYVKEPVPGRYEWIFDLDLTSLYPSIIMSLNISPETKVGRVYSELALVEVEEGKGRHKTKKIVKTPAWNPEKFITGETEKVYLSVEALWASAGETDLLKQTANDDYKSDTLSLDDFKELLAKENLSVSSCGVLYRKGELGIIPDILDKWFKQRKEYRKLEKQFGDKYNAEKKTEDKDKYIFYSRRQHTQKILLNAMYGALGLPVFRFYSLDNAESVTTTGVTIVKTTARIGNAYYSRILGEEKDYCIYSDTDSSFFSALPIIKKLHPEVDTADDAAMSKHVIEIATQLQDFINKSYDILAQRAFNLEKHRFSIKQEVIAKTGFWVKKKRYAQWIINKAGVVCDELEVKGLDMVRSSFPEKFRQLEREILLDILKGGGQPEADKRLTNFIKAIQTFTAFDLAKTTTVGKMDEYEKGNFKRAKEDRDKNKVMTGSVKKSKAVALGGYAKGTPAHYKAAIAYNQFIKKYDLMTEPITESSGKIKWIWLKKNPVQFDCMAFKGYEEHPKVMEFIDKYADKKGQFETELKGKIQDIYKALGWAFPSEQDDKIREFFEF